MKRRAPTWLAVAWLVTSPGCEQQTSRPRPEDRPTATTAARGAGSVATATAAARSSAATSASAKPARCSPSCTSIERCEAGRCVASCPKGEVYVPATGPDGFIMGAGLHGPKDPPHEVVLTKPFCMDATEVTVKAYKACVEEGGCDEPVPWGTWRNYPKLLEHPMNKVGWKEARKFCQFRNKDLPSEAQWEWAATGGDRRKWPWGNDRPTCKHADFVKGVLEGPASDDGCHGGGTSPVGTHPDGDRVWPDGHIHDLAGNVWEWVLDNYRSYRLTPQTDPLFLKVPDGVHVVRGGGWNRSHRGIRSQYRGGAAVDYRVPGLGFRCVRNPEGSGPGAEIGAK